MSLYAWDVERMVGRCVLRLKGQYLRAHFAPCSAWVMQTGLRHIFHTPSLFFTVLLLRLRYFSLSRALDCVAYVKLDHVDKVISLFENVVNTLELNSNPSSLYVFRTCKRD